MKGVLIISFHASPLSLPGNGYSGGMSVYVRELSQALARSGLECHVLTRIDNPNLAKSVIKEPGFYVHYIPGGPATGLAPSELFNQDYIEEFVQNAYLKVKELNYQGIYFSAIQANYYLSAIIGHKLKHELELPLFVSFHTLEALKNLNNPFQERILAEQESIDCADVVLASCVAERDQILDKYIVNPDRIRILPPGVERAYFQPGNRSQARKAIGATEDETLVLYVGRIEELKGTSVLVSAMARYVDFDPNSRLLIIGGPTGNSGVNEIQKISKIVRETPKLELCILDPVGHETLSTYMRAADAVVVPSYSESFGLVALEAMACAIPVIASRVGGLLNLVEDSVSGLLFHPGDIFALNRQLSRLLKDEALSAEISYRGWICSQEFSWSRSANMFRKYLEEVQLETLVSCG